MSENETTKDPIGEAMDKVVLDTYKAVVNWLETYPTPNVIKILKDKIAEEERKAAKE